MTDDPKAREGVARREFPQTRAAFDRVRATAVKNLLASKPDESAKREELYRLIHILDGVQAELSAFLANDTAAVDKYIESLQA